MTFRRRAAPAWTACGWTGGGRAAAPLLLPHQKLVPMLNWKVSNSSSVCGRKFFE